MVRITLFVEGDLEEMVDGMKVVKKVEKVTGRKVVADPKNEGVICNMKLVK